MLVRNYQAVKWTKSVKMLSFYPSLSAFTMSTILPSCPTVISILFKPLHNHFFPNTLCIILWCSLWHPWNTVAFILHRTCHILYMLHVCWFRTAVLYPPRDNPYGIHGRGGGFQKFQMESMEGGVDSRNSRWNPWNGGWIPWTGGWTPYFFKMDSMKWGMDSMDWGMDSILF